MKKATFAAGCFWGVEATFRKIKGVLSSAVGYQGGNFVDPSYEDVCSGKTGHAEVVELTYDPDVVTYSDLLDTFWACHNPTTLNRQGLDVGTQYRSAIFFHDEEQKKRAEGSIKLNQGLWPTPIVTEISPTSTFYKAEEYHQQYIEKQR